MLEIELYDSAVLALGLMGLVLLLQMLVVGLAAMKAKHRPGYPVTADHQSFLFRAVRAQANSNESIAVYILLLLFGMFSGANPHWLANMAWLSLLGRIGHMLFYYAGLSLARSIAYGLTVLGLAGMAILAVMAYVA